MSFNRTIPEAVPPPAAAPNALAEAQAELAAAQAALASAVKATEKTKAKRAIKAAEKKLSKAGAVPEQDLAAARQQQETGPSGPSVSPDVFVSAESSGVLEAQAELAAAQAALASAVKPTEKTKAKRAIKAAEKKLSKAGVVLEQDLAAARQQQETGPSGPSVSPDVPAVASSGARTAASSVAVPVSAENSDVAETQVELATAQGSRGTSFNRTIPEVVPSPVAAPNAVAEAQVELAAAQVVKAGAVAGAAPRAPSTSFRAGVPVSAESSAVLEAQAELAAAQAALASAVKAPEQTKASRAITAAEKKL